MHVEWRQFMLDVKCGNKPYNSLYMHRVFMPANCLLKSHAKPETFGSDYWNSFCN